MVLMPHLRDRQALPPRIKVSRNDHLVHQGLLLLATHPIDRCYAVVPSSVRDRVFQVLQVFSHLMMHEDVAVSVPVCSTLRSRHHHHSVLLKPVHHHPGGHTTSKHPSQSPSLMYQVCLTGNVWMLLQDIRDLLHSQKPVDVV